LLDFIKYIEMINAAAMEMNDDLLVSTLLGEATPAEDKQIEQWRKENPANETRYQQFKTIWDKSQQLQYTGKIDAGISLQRLKQKIARQAAAAREKREEQSAMESNTQKKVVRFWSGGYLTRIAAALLLFAGAGWLYTNQFSANEVEFLTQQTVEADTLSDGSVITMNKHSLLRYPNLFKGNQREVWLTKGEAFFDITPDKKKPFIIRTGSTSIKVVGTSFNVKNKGEQIEVIVETGKVEVSRSGKTVSLQPGEKVLIKQQQRELIKEKNPDQLYNYYRSNEFVADNIPLRRVVEVLNEAYGSNIVIARKELENFPLNTTFRFKDEPLGQLLNVISRTFNIKVEKKANQILLY
jgi:transmembrane sensor